MEFIPFGERVVVEQVETKKEEGAFIMPESEDKSLVHKVVNSNIEGIVKGDHILIQQYMGIEVKDQKSKARIVDKENILAIVKL